MIRLTSLYLLVNSAIFLKPMERRRHRAKTVHVPGVQMLSAGIRKPFLTQQSPNTYHGVAGETYGVAKRTPIPGLAGAPVGLLRNSVSVDGISHSRNVIFEPHPRPPDLLKFPLSRPSA